MTTIWSDDWDSLGESEWEGGTKSSRLAGGERLGASLYELPPGGVTSYHFHHGSEEILVALEEGLTLRTPDGERELARGETVHFSRGPEGAHGQLNRGSEPVRYLMVSTRESPEVVEYPDLGQLTAQSRFPSQTGEGLFVIHDLGGGAAG